MSHSALFFIRFDIIISSQRFLLFDVLSRSAFVNFILMSFHHYLPFNVLYFRCFLLFDVLSVDLFSHSTFCPLTFFVVGVFYFDILSVNHKSVISMQKRFLSFTASVPTSANLNTVKQGLGYGHDLGILNFSLTLLAMNVQLYICNPENNIIFLVRWLN